MVLIMTSYRPRKKHHVANRPTLSMRHALIPFLDLSFIILPLYNPPSHPIQYDSCQVTSLIKPCVLQHLCLGDLINNAYNGTYAAKCF